MKLAVTSLALALVGTFGSLFLSLGLGLKACPLCFYQRAFVMSTAAVLAIGLLADRSRPALYGILSLPLTVAGLGVASFHEYLVVTKVLECPSGLLGLGTAPAQSLVIFIALAAVVVPAAWSNYGKAFCLSMVVGVLMAIASVASSPPLPPTPKAPYDPAKQPLDMCRPPFREAQPGN
jgi:disulfide bond formation protein DsbB